MSQEGSKIELINGKLTVPNELLGRPVVVHRLYCEYNFPSDICFFTLTSNISHTLCILSYNKLLYNLYTQHAQHTTYPLLLTPLGNPAHPGKAQWNTKGVSYAFRVLLRGDQGIPGAGVWLQVEYYLYCLLPVDSGFRICTLNAYYTVF